jgi:Fe-S oxidoreductase
MALSEFQQDMETCCRCSACKFIPLENVKGFNNVNVCPSISRYNFHAYSGGGRLGIGMAMLEKEIEYSDKLLEVIYNCQMCGACDVSCKYAMDMEVLEPINAIRMECVESGHTLPALDKMAANLRQTGSQLAASTKGNAWFDDLKVKNYAQQKTEVLYHAGCRTTRNPKMWNVAQLTVKLMQKAGVDIGIAGNQETCCGGRVYQLGYKADFMNQAEANMQKLAKSGIKTLVTGCAECYYSFKVLYERFNLIGEIEVLHTSQYFARLVKEGRLTPHKIVDMNVTYHDPCHLGRLGEPYIHWSGKQIPGQIRLFDPPKEFRRGSYGVYEPPRELLRSIPGLKLTEMERIKEFAWCCGAGGGVQENNPRFAEWTAAERIKEAASTGAKTIITACPGCQTLLKAVTKSQSSDLKVYDIVEILAESVL